jgi:hypothetical protein
MTQNKNNSFPEQTIPSPAAPHNLTSSSASEAIRLETANQKQVVTSLNAAIRAMAGASVLPKPNTA